MSTEMTLAPHESLFAEFRRLSPKVTGGVMRMRDEAYADGKVEGKYKLLTALAISVSIRCEPCIRAYTKMSLDHGASLEELIEFLNVAITMQGCPGEEWALKAFQFYKEFTEGEAGPVGESCCA